MNSQMKFEEMNSQIYAGQGLEGSPAQEPLLGWGVPLSQHVNVVSRSESPGF